ncbi:DNA (cytosine-5-)-methyltransferase [Ranunculus cassubicifolius]
MPSSSTSTIPPKPPIHKPKSSNPKTSSSTTQPVPDLMELDDKPSKLQIPTTISPKIEDQMEIVTDLLPTSKSSKRKRQPPKTQRKPPVTKKTQVYKEKRRTLDKDCVLDGDPMPLSESHRRWPDRYLGAEGDENYIGKIVEFFKTTDHRSFFTAQWFFKAKDTVIENDHAEFIDAKRVFISEYKNDNPLDCILQKLTIVQIAPNIDVEAKKKSIPPDCDYYFDMQYSKSYSTFCNIPKNIIGQGSGESSSNAIDSDDKGVIMKTGSTSGKLAKGAEMSLLDLYAGCGGMSTGLCLGAATAGIQLSTKWAVDLNEHACQSLKINHPTIEVRHEKAEDFLSVLKEWRKLCEDFGFLGPVQKQIDDLQSKKTDKDENNNEPESLSENDNDEDSVESDDSEQLEVNFLVGICVGDPNDTGTTQLHFKVRWLGYEAKDDTWEPLANLNCREKLYEFVKAGYEANILPLTGKIDVICGGPPCQGISGHNRFRDKDEPLRDPKNHQLVVFMDIVEYLKPRFVLMENVVDILKFAKGFLIRYAIGRLVSLSYQSRMGMLAAGSYGLPQYRMRAFLWGALPTENLPSFPLPTHHVVKRGGTPTEFVQNLVAYDADQQPNLRERLLIGDAISELPPVKTGEKRDVIPYDSVPETDFQRFIRRSENELMGINDLKKNQCSEALLFDHLPLKLSDDDMIRVELIPKKKKANFRDLPGLRFVDNNKRAVLDPDVERRFLDSGKPLVPDYCLSWKGGCSTEPFGRLWWDETVSTVVTRAQPHNRKILHWEQDRVLTIRENARLQGFPDYYRFSGPVKEKYMQVGNAVAVPVARALGHVLGLASRGGGSGQPVTTLPPNFSRFVLHDKIVCLSMYVFCQN